MIQRLPVGVEQADRLRSGEGETSEVATRRHRTDEHARVGGVVLHPHPVAEDRAAGERRRRVDREHRRLEIEAAQVPMIADVRVLFPEPGAPVRPIV